MKRWVVESGGTAPADLDEIVERTSRAGSTPLVVADGADILGVIELKDVVKQGIREKFAEMRQMGIRTVMITGDNPLTAAAIAQEAGVDDFLAEATPEAKMALIKKEQEGGRLVAMTGDGTNDAPALAQADVGVAMNTGTTAAKEAGNMVDLDSNPTKLIDVVEIGKQLLITRGSLTTFSIANDVAKYFAIIPALFAGTYVFHHHRPLEALNIMHLHNAQSAVLSAVIFNALVIIALIPLALRGRQVSSDRFGVDPSSQRLDLRRRWCHRAVHLHQTDRPDPRRSSRLLKGNPNARPPSSIAGHGSLLPGLLRLRLRLRRHRSGPGTLPVPRRRLGDEERVTAHRPELGRDQMPGKPPGSCVFHGRPDDTGPYAANAKDDVSGGDNPLVANGIDGESAATNLGPHSRTLKDNTIALVRYWHNLGVNPTIDLVTTSGSGYDPDISALDATVQIPMITKATGISATHLRTLIKQQTHPAQFGFMGSSYIDVLQLNEGLAKLEK